MAQLLRILADTNIPLATEAFGGFGEVRKLPGHAITSAELADVDVLLVRSVTKIDEQLLAGSAVRFVGTATAGTDHVDVDYLRRAEIGFASAPGSNATSVVEYTLAALISTAADMGVGLRGCTLGVVGCGWIGEEVAVRAEALGMDVLRCDPPLDAQHPRPSPYAALDEVLAQSDFVTIHTPLTPTKEEAYATYHLIGPAALAMMKPEAVLINTARGAVVDNAALKAALQTHSIAGAALDVWEGEPEVDTDLVRLVRIATPHIAGYSFDGKLEGTRMLEEALRVWLVGRAEYAPPAWDSEAALGVMQSKDLVLHALPVQDGIDELNEVRWLNVLVRQAYNLRKDDTRFRQVVLGAPPSERAAAFRELRRTYPVRRTWGRFTVMTVIPEWLEDVVTMGLGMVVVQ
jgi:erythronate-4-phosphate dehydrogenase